MQLLWPIDRHNGTAISLDGTDNPVGGIVDQFAFGQEDDVGHGGAVLG